MKNTGKIMSVILAVSMLLGVTSCGREPKISPDDLMKASKKYDSREYDDLDDFIEYYREADDFEKPIIINTKGRKAQKLYEDRVDYGYDVYVDVDTITMYSYRHDNEDDPDDYGHMDIYSIVCDNNKEAKRLYEALARGIRLKDDPKIVSEEDDQPFIVVYEPRPEFTDVCYWGVYRYGDTVLSIDGMCSDTDTKIPDMFKYFCKKLNITNPEEALKQDNKEE